MSVPKLRFPEFRDEGEWEEYPLNKITTSIFDGTHQTPKYKDEGIPFFSVENIVSGKTNKFISEEDHLVATNKNKPEKGDILITRIGNIGFSTVVDWDYEFSIYVTLAIVKNDEKFNSYYLHSFMQSEQYQKEIKSKSLLNAVPCKINMDELRKTKILLPSPEEQQKIADCLTSLADRITLETQKLDTLKTHKKGLMQQLFPAEGETLPKLRFPEFKKPWKEGTIENLSITVMGNAFKSNDFVEYGIQLVRMGNLYQGELQLNRTPVYLPTVFSEEYSNFLVKPLDLLMSMTGTVGKKDYGFIVQVPKNCKPLLLNQRVMKIEPKENCIKEFLLQMLKNESLLNKLYSSAGGTKQANLSSQQLKDLNITFPQQPEQQKITDCLSSIDEAIASQSQAIDLLKLHKKGLIQQLFPSVEEVKG